MYIGGWRRGYMYSSCLGNHCSILSIYSCSHHPEDSIALDRYSGPMRIGVIGVKQLIQLQLSVQAHSKLTIYGVSH